MDPTKWILRDGSYETHNDPTTPDPTTPDPTTIDLMTIYVNDSTTCMQLADPSS